jgi:hypothetical protein
VVKLIIFALHVIEVSFSWHFFCLNSEICLFSDRYSSEEHSCFCKTETVQKIWASDMSSRLIPRKN